MTGNKGGVLLGGYESHYRTRWALWWSIVEQPNNIQDDHSLVFAVLFTEKREVPMVFLIRGSSESYVAYVDLALRSATRD